jgi:hypothetical protein
MASVLLGIFGDKSAITHSPENALQQIPRRLQPLYKRLCAKGKFVMAVTDMLHGLLSMSKHKQANNQLPRPIPI